MDLQLSGRRIWITGVGHPWAVAGAFLLEGAHVQVFTSESPLAAVVAASASRLRVFRLRPDARLLDPALRADALAAGAPDVLVHLRWPDGREAPSLHEWDEFAARNATLLNSGGSLLVVETGCERAASEEASAVLAKERWRIWRTLSVADAVTVVCGRPGGEDAHDPAGAFPALVAFLAVRGRGRIALLDPLGRVQLL